MSRVLTLPDEFKGAEVTWNLDQFLYHLDASQTARLRVEEERKSYVEVLKQVETFLSYMLATEPDYFRKAAKEFNSESREARIRVQDEQVKIQLLPKEPTT
jgi:hypothetical protein